MLLPPRSIVTRRPCLRETAVKPHLTRRFAARKSRLAVRTLSGTPIRLKDNVMPQHHSLQPRRQPLPERLYKAFPRSRSDCRRGCRRTDSPCRWTKNGRARGRSSYQHVIHELLDGLDPLVRSANTELVPATHRHTVASTRDWSGPMNVTRDHKVMGAAAQLPPGRRARRYSRRGVLSRMVRALDLLKMSGRAEIPDQGGAFDVRPALVVAGRKRSSQRSGASGSAAKVKKSAWR